MSIWCYLYVRVLSSCHLTWWHLCTPSKGLSACLAAPAPSLDAWRWLALPVLPGKWIHVRDTFTTHDKSIKCFATLTFPSPGATDEHKGQVYWYNFILPDCVQNMIVQEYASPSGYLTFKIHNSQLTGRYKMVLQSCEMPHVRWAVASIGKTDNKSNSTSTTCHRSKFTSQNIVVQAK